MGTTCLSQARNPFCVINTKSLADPLLVGPEIWVSESPDRGQGGQRNLSEAQITVCHEEKTVKKHYSANYKLSGPLGPPSLPIYCHPSFTSATSLNPACS